MTGTTDSGLVRGLLLVTVLSTAVFGLVSCNCRLEKQPIVGAITVCDGEPTILDLLWYTPQGGKAATPLTPEAAGEVVYIPAAAHVGGAANTNWRTDVELHALFREPASVRIALLVHGQANPTPQVETVDLGPGEARRFEDILLELFGFEGAAALRIETLSGTVAVSSRTYNLLDADNDLGLPAGATFGQYIGGAVPEQAVEHGGEGRIVNLREDDDFRSNLGLVNATGGAIDVVVELYAGRQLDLVGTRPVQLAPFEYRQLNRVYAPLTSDPVAFGYATVTTTTPDGRFFAYGSAVDNRTGDPTYIPAGVGPMAAGKRTSYVDSGHLLVAAAANVVGAAGTDWHTDLMIHSPEELALFHLELLEADHANLEPRRWPEDTSHFIQPGWSVHLTDVLTELDFEGAAAIRVVQDEGYDVPLVVTSRTYNLTADGTYGQFIGGVGEDDALIGYQPATMMQLTHDDDFRTNMGFVSCVPFPIVVAVELYAADGTLLGTFEQPLDGREYLQINRVFERVGASDVDDGWALVYSPINGSRYMAYASVVDNLTGDPVYVPARFLGEWTPLLPNLPEPPHHDMHPKTLGGLVNTMFQVDPQGLAAAFDAGGTDGLADFVMDALPGIASGDDAGLVLDFGDGYLTATSAIVEGRLDISFTRLKLTSSEIELAGHVMADGYRVNGGAPPVDTLAFDVDMQREQDDNVAGSISLQGSGPGKTTASTLTGDILINTSICALFPYDGTLTIEVDGEQHTIIFAAFCNGWFHHDGPPRGTVVSLDVTRTFDGNYLTGGRMYDASEVLYQAEWDLALADRFTPDSTADADVLFTGVVVTDFLPEELAHVEAFVRGGGGLVVVLENPEVPTAAAASLAALFAVEYDLDHQHSGDGSSAVEPIAWHPIWQGVAGSASSYAIHAPSAILSPPSSFIGVNDWDSSAAMAAIEYHQGRVVFLTDVNAFNGTTTFDQITPEPGTPNAVVWENLFDWVAGGPESR